MASGFTTFCLVNSLEWSLKPTFYLKHIDIISELPMSFEKRSYKMKKKTLERCTAQVCYSNATTGFQ